jgi:hypothetical protein
MINCVSASLRQHHLATKFLAQHTPSRLASARDDRCGDDGDGLGTVAVALAVDVAVLVGWLRRGISGRGY